MRRLHEAREAPRYRGEEGHMATDERDEVARLLEEAATALDRSSAHCRTAARHFREREVPRGCAHALAAEGDLAIAREQLTAVARAHASHAAP